MKLRFYEKHKSNHIKNVRFVIQQETSTKNGDFVKIDIICQSK